MTYRFVVGDISYICLSVVRQKQQKREKSEQKDMETRLELTNLSIIKQLRSDTNQYISCKKMTTCRQIKGFKDNEGPCPRWGHFMYPLKDELLIFGGYENSNYYNDLWLFNIKTLTFSKVQQSGQLPPPCSNFTMNFDQYRNRLILFGGGSLNKAKLNSLYELNLTTYSWKQIKWNEKEPYPEQRSYHCAEIIDKYLIVFGGEFFNDFGDLWIFDLINNNWKEVKFPVGSIEPAPRRFASSFVWNNKMYIFSGCRDKYLCLSDMYSIDFTNFLATKDTSNLLWKPVKVLNQDFILRWGHVCAIRDDKVYVFGGRCKNKDLHNIVQIDLTNEKCQEIAINGNVPKGRRRPGFCLKNNTLFCLSGFDGTYIKDFLYMPLMSLPKQSQKKIQTCLFQSLRQEFDLTQPQGFESSLDEDVLILERDSYSKILHKESSSIDKPIKINAFQGCVSQYDLKTFAYFDILLKMGIQQLQIYLPMQIPKRDSKKAIEYFLIYLKCQKVIFDCKDKSEITKYLDYLIIIAEYYCMKQLEEMILKYKFRRFQKRLNSKKFTLKDITEEAANIAKTNIIHGQYACYQMLIKIIEESNIYDIKQLKEIMMTWIYPTEITWIIEIISKYEFQLYQRVLHKDKELNQNTVAFPAEWIPSKTESRPETSLFCTNMQMI